MACDLSPARLGRPNDCDVGISQTPFEKKNTCAGVSTEAENGRWQTRCSPHAVRL